MSAATLGEIPWLRRAVARAAALAGIVVVVVAVRHVLLDNGASTKQTAQRVTLLTPPPRKPEIKPEEPEPEIVKAEVDVERPPQDAPPQEAASGQLGVVGEGEAGDSAFGLVAKKSGRDITTIGDDAATVAARAPIDPMLQFGPYAGRVARFLEDALAAHDELRRGNYTAVVRLWVTPDGGIRRLELARSTGDLERDPRIRAAFGEIGRLREPPPADMPQPMRLRLTSREAG
jgi:protein TonB